MKSFLLISVVLNCFICAYSYGKDCIEDLQQKICFVEKAADNPNQSHEDYIKNIQERKCQPLDDSIKSRVVETVKSLPEELKPIFCEVKKIFIEKDFYATGYATSYYSIIPKSGPNNEDMVQATGWIIGLSFEKIFNSPWSLAEWLNRKEQTLFGLDMKDDTPKDHPQFSIEFDHNTISQENALMYQVLIHEVGHLLDQANRVNLATAINCEDDGTECDVEFISQWSLLTWTTSGDWRTEAQYWPNKPCYYGCRNDSSWTPILLSEAKDFYKSFFEKAEFISIYSSVHPMEDFAETLTYYLTQRDTISNSLYIDNQEHLLEEKWHKSPILSIKYRFMKNFFAGQVNYKPSDRAFPLRTFPQEDKSSSKPIIFID